MSGDDPDDANSTDENDHLSDDQSPDAGQNSPSYDAEHLADAVREDPTLNSDEKEFIITMPKDDDKAYIFCEITGPMRRLLKHDGVTVTSVRVYNDDGTSEETGPHHVTDGAIVAVWGEAARGYVKVGSRCRNDSSPASIVSRDASASPDDAEFSIADEEGTEADTKEEHSDSDTTDADDKAESTESDRSGDDDDDWMAGQISSGPPDDGDEGDAATSTQDSGEDDPEEGQDEDDDLEARSSLDW